MFVYSVFVNVATMAGRLSRLGSGTMHEQMNGKNEARREKNTANIVENTNEDFEKFVAFNYIPIEMIPIKS